MRKLIPQSECKDKIKLYKCLKNKKVISGRPEMTENKSPSVYERRSSYHTCIHCRPHWHSQILWFLLTLLEFLNL